MIGFFGCDLASDREAARALERMGKSAVVGSAAGGTAPSRDGVGRSAVVRVGSRAAWFGPREAAGATDGDDWVVVSGYVRRGRRVLDASAVLDHLQRRGARGVAELTGEFSLAARAKGATFLARDRYGTRPLYHAPLGRGRVFATSIGPLLAAGVPKMVDRGGVITSLVLGYVPAPATVLEHVSQVPPGHVVELGGRPRATAYYVPRERLAGRSLAASARALDRALTRAVEHAPTNGRVGAFLSGGLDSSLVLARLVERGLSVEAFTLHFGDRLPSEIRYAESVARHLGVRHHVLELSARAFCDALGPSLVHLEDLLSEPIAVPNFLLAREVAKSRDVVFTGEGGDPLFGGPKNVGMVLERAYGARRIGLAYLSAHHHLADDLDEAITPEWRAAFDEGALASTFERRFARPRRGETFVGQLMVTNLAMKGGSNINVKVSKMVSAHGLALRSPLFDPEVVELGLAIPPWHKLEGTDEKIVLKRAVARTLPREVVDRPKRGMAVPLRAWLETDALGELARDVLTPRRVRERGIFRPEWVCRLLAFEKLPGELARSRGAEKLWLVLICEIHQRALERGAA